MEHGHEITLRQGDGKNAPNLLGDLKQVVDDLMPAAAAAASKFITAKGDAEQAKVAEIKARALKAIGEIEHDRLRLIEERDRAVEAAKDQRECDRLAHEERMYELRTERLKAVIDRLMSLRSLGVEVDLVVVADILVSAANKDAS